MTDQPKPAVPRRVEKPWGHELIWAHTERYVGKTLHIKAGHALSLQYHQVKDETLHCLAGEMELELDEGQGYFKRRLNPGESYHVQPGTRHRMTAITDTDILEASTPELGDVVRLEDRYGRSGSSKA